MGFPCQLAALHPEVKKRSENQVRLCTIPGAYVIVLNSGVTYEAWSAANFPVSDVFTNIQAGSNRQYVLLVKWTRNTPYTIGCSAK
jgi:hypothetical protein